MGLSCGSTWIRTLRLRSQNLMYTFWTPQCQLTALPIPYTQASTSSRQMPITILVIHHVIPGIASLQYPSVSFSDLGGFVARRRISSFTPDKWQASFSSPNNHETSSRKPGGGPHLRYVFRGRRGLFLRPPHVRDFVKEGYFFVPRYEVWGSKSPYNPRNICSSDAE